MRRVRSSWATIPVSERRPGLSADAGRPPLGSLRHARIVPDGPGTVIEIGTGTRVAPAGVVARPDACGESASLRPLPWWVRYSSGDSYRGRLMPRAPLIQVVDPARVTGSGCSSTYFSPFPDGRAVG